jgi:hypothetical protein
LAAGDGSAGCCGVAAASAVGFGGAAGLFAAGGSVGRCGGVVEDSVGPVVGFGGTGLFGSAGGCADSAGPVVAFGGAGEGSGVGFGEVDGLFAVGGSVGRVSATAAGS